MRVTLFALFGFLLAAFFATSGVAIAKDRVGTITFVQGEAYVARDDMAREQAIQDDALFQGDTVFTTEVGYVKVEFLDQTSFVLNGEDGVLSIDEYVFDVQNPEQAKARFNVLKASFVYVSGLIGKNEQPDVEIGLDFGTIGIRGTTIRRSMRGEECWILLEDGKIQVFNDGGSVDLLPGEATRIRSHDIAPVAAEVWVQDDIDWIRSDTNLLN